MMRSFLPFSRVNGSREERLEDLEDDEDEEKLDLRVDASRQELDELPPEDKRRKMRRMSSSTSSTHQPPLTPKLKPLHVPSSMQQKTIEKPSHHVIPMPTDVPAIPPPPPARASGPVKSNEAPSSPQKSIFPPNEVRSAVGLASSATAPFIQLTKKASDVFVATTERLTVNVTDVLSATSEKLHMNGMVDSMAGAMTTVSEKLNVNGMVDSMAGAVNSLVQNSLMLATTRKSHPEAYYSVESRLLEAKEQHLRLKMQAFWQLLITGFEVVAHRISKRAKKRVLWLSLDGKLYLDGNKREKKASNAMYLWIQRGSDAYAFAKSLSWRDARNKDTLTFSIHSKHGKEQEKVFACQVLKPSVRNLLVENFETLLKMIQGDTDGEFPFHVQKRIAYQYAVSGELMTLRQVEDILQREEEEGKSNSGQGPNSGDKTTGLTIDFMRQRGNGRRSDDEADDHDDDGSDNDSDFHEEEDQRKILG